MDLETVVILAVFLVVLGLCASGIRLLLPIIAQHFKGAADGWGRLSEFYATTRERPAQLARRQSLVVGQILYRNCISLGFDNLGLYLECGFPLSILGRRPLFVPWKEFKRVEEGRLFWRRAAVLSLGEPRVGTITVPMDLFNHAIRPAIGDVAAGLVR